MAETGQTGKMRLILMGMSWKGKIVGTAALIKLLMGATMNWKWAVWVKPWVCMPVECFWNMMTAHIIIKQAQIRGIGVATVHEVRYIAPIPNAFGHRLMRLVSVLESLLGEMCWCRCLTR